MNIWDVLPKLKKIREEKERLRQEQERAARIEDLFHVLHRVGDVELPIPNLFAKVQIERILGSLDQVNIEDDRQLATIVWILKNQHRIEIGSMNPDEVEKEVNRMMQQLPLSHMVQYRQCLAEIFTALQKKTLVDEMAILQEALQILEAGEPS